MRKFCIVFFALITISLITTQGSAAEFKCANNEIVIGIVKAKTGPFAFFDNVGAQGAIIGADIINSQGGIDGCKLKVIRGDTKSDPALARQVAEELIKKGAQILIVPADFDIGIGASQAAQEKGLLSLSPEASSTAWVKAVGPNHFTSAITIEDIGKGEVAFAEMKDWKKMYIVTNTAFNYFTAQEKVFRQYYKGQVVGRDVVPDNATDYSPFISKIRKMGAKIDAVFLNDYFPHVGTFIKQLRSAGVSVPILGNQSYSSKALPEVVGKKGIQGVYYVAQGYYEGSGVSPEVGKLNKLYIQRFTNFPENANALAGYEGIFILANALKKAGSTDASAVSEAISAQTNYNLPGSVLYKWTDRYPVRSVSVIGFDDKGNFIEAAKLDTRKIK